MSQQANTELVRNLTPYFERSGTRSMSMSRAIGVYQNLPGLRGFWPFTSHDSNGDAIDVSGVGMLANRNGAIDFREASGVPLTVLAGGGQYFDIVPKISGDDDITGLEAYILPAQRGLTIGGWVRPTTLDATNRGVIGKWASSTDNRAYLLYINSSNRFAFTISRLGTNATTRSVAAGDVASVNNWHFAVGRFTPGSEMKIWTNEVENSSTSSIEASIYGSSTSALEIGRYWSSSYLYFIGNLAFPFICAMALPDYVIFHVFQQTMPMFDL